LKSTKKKPAVGRSTAGFFFALFEKKTINPYFLPILAVE
jgi:hypothetical protein